VVNMPKNKKPDKGVITAQEKALNPSNIK